MFDYNASTIGTMFIINLRRYFCRSSSLLTFRLKPLLFSSVYQLIWARNGHFCSVSERQAFLFFSYFLTKLLFFLLFREILIFSYFLAILPFILVLYRLFITIISCKNHRDTLLGRWTSRQGEL